MVTSLGGVSRRQLLKWSFGAAAAAVPAGMAAAHLGLLPAWNQSYGLLPAEFENQQAILFGWYKNFRPGAKQAFIESVRQVSEVAQAIVLVAEPENRKYLDQQFAKFDSRENIQLIDHPFVMPWVRDFGPLVVKSADGRHTVIDYQYEVNREDNGIPKLLADTFGLPRVEAPLKLHAGNLLSNGTGLCLSTEQLMHLNNQIGFSESKLQKIVQRYLGIDELVLLEPMIGEKTGHVDMFSTFVAPNVVLVGQYDPKVDRYNAPVLDRNAERLEGLATRNGPLKVVRIPMPRRSSGWWYTYTNVIYINGRVLVPSFSDVDPAVEQQAMDIYRREMPGWEIVPIDCTEFVIGNGVLHCASMNMISLT